MHRLQAPHKTRAAATRNSLLPQPSPRSGLSPTLGGRGRAAGAPRRRAALLKTRTVRIQGAWRGRCFWPHHRADAGSGCELLRPIQGWGTSEQPLVLLAVESRMACVALWLDASWHWNLSAVPRRTEQPTQGPPPPGLGRASPCPAEQPSRPFAPTLT